MEKIRLQQAVIVEGKYDKIKLEALVDAVILPTDGFRIFKDKEMRALIRSLAHTRGILVLTDSDAAGFQIRAHVRSIAAGGQVLHAYIPDIFGREKRKRTTSAEGKLGVEGMNLLTLRTALERAGAGTEAPPKGEALTKLDLYEQGLCGGPESAAKRRALFTALGLPARLSANAALPILQGMLTREEFLHKCAQL